MLQKYTNLFSIMPTKAKSKVGDDLGDVRAERA
jgi:hypothetical protein